MDAPSAPLWPSLLGIALGASGLLLSISLALWNVFLYLRKPVIRVDDQERHSDGNPVGDDELLILLRVSVVNHSNSGKVIYRLGYGHPCPDTVQVQEAEGILSDNRMEYAFQLPNSGIERPLPTDVVFHWPLDVSPNHSVSKWVGLMMTKPASIASGGLKVSLPLYAYNVYGKRIASTVAYITL